MNEISKAGFYKNWFEIANSLTDSNERLMFYEMIFNYYFLGVEPQEEMTFLLKTVFLAVKANIDADLNRKKGGAPVGNNNAEKQPKKQLEKQPKNNGCFEVENNSKTNNVNVNDNDNVNEDDNVNKPVIVRESPSMQSFSKLIFDIFKNAGLPCARSNEISFLQTDFKNGLSYIRNNPELKNFTSQEIVEACKHYAEIVQRSDTWVTQRMNFYSFAKSKLFYNFLPSNYDLNNYIKVEKDGEKPEQKKTIIQYLNDPCPNCNDNKLHWVESKKRFVCASCNDAFTMETIFPEM